jgi:hypothetical protein
MVDLGVSFRVAQGRRQKAGAGDRRQKSGDLRQNAEGRTQNAEGRKQKAESRVSKRQKAGRPSAGRIVLN